MASIETKPLPGGLRETFDGSPYDLLLTMGDIEAWEDAHPTRGLIGLREALGIQGISPKIGEVSDLLVLALSSTHKDPDVRNRFVDADAAANLVTGALPAEALRHQMMARALLAVTLEPHLFAELAELEVTDGGDDAGKARGDG